MWACVCPKFFPSDPPPPPFLSRQRVDSAPQSQCHSSARESLERRQAVRVCVVCVCVCVRVCACVLGALLSQHPHPCHVIFVHLLMSLSPSSHSSPPPIPPPPPPPPPFPSTTHPVLSSRPLWRWNDRSPRGKSCNVRALITDGCDEGTIDSLALDVCVRACVPNPGSSGLPTYSGVQCAQSVYKYVCMYVGQTARVPAINTCTTRA